MNTFNNNKHLTVDKQYLYSLIILVVFIVILFFVQEVIGYQTVSLILLLLIFLLPLFSFERGPTILTAVVSAFAWDYYFIPPHFTLYIAKAEDVVTLFMFFFVAVTNGVLTARLRAKENESAEKEKKSNALYNLLKALSRAEDLNEVIIRTIVQICQTFGFESVIFFSKDHKYLDKNPHPTSTFETNVIEWNAAELSFNNKVDTGKTTSYLNYADAFYFPVMINDLVLCVIGIKINEDYVLHSAKMKFLKAYIKEVVPFFEKFSDYSIP